MNKRYCDLCGYDTTETYRHWAAHVHIVGPSTGGEFDRQLDLCVDCARALRRAAEDRKPKDEAA